MSDYLQSLQECLTVMASLRGLEDELGRAAERCAASLKSGGKLLLCGNGGSAAEAIT
jgi:phosphoheptose isomerase